MHMFREIPPTAGLPIIFSDFIALFARDGLERKLKQHLNAANLWVTYSGTAALYLILETLKKFSSKKTVVIPSFVCPLVPLAVIRAGLRVEVCDIKRDSFNFDLSMLETICRENKDILAIVPVHLAGIPLGVSPVIQLAKTQDIFVIEDCAQALGAEYSGEKVGTFGDFSFFSLCRGKGLTIYEGGFIVCNRAEYVDAVNQTLNNLVRNDYLSEALKLFELFGYWLVYRPLFFWFAFGLPQTYWNWRKQPLRAAQEFYDVNFPTHRVSELRRKVGAASLARLKNSIEDQRKKALFYVKELKNLKGLRIISENANSKATYPYMVLLFDEPVKKQAVKHAFKNLGLGISEIYACSICDYDYLKSFLKDGNCENARFIAQRTLTLSTSTYLTEENLLKIVEIIKKVIS